MPRPTETSLLLLFALAAGACDDPSFIAVQAPEAGPPVRTDAGVDGGFDLGD